MNLKKITDFFKTLNKNRRHLALLLSSLFVFNYLMFSYLTDKNIFDIFPSFPVIEQKNEITVFLPAIDGKSEIQEKRKVIDFKNSENYIQFLFYIVVKGSMYNNTSIAVPSEMIVKKVWINKGKCIIDVESIVQKSQGVKTLDAEENFKRVLAKTITTNLPKIKSISITVNGVEDSRIW